MAAQTARLDRTLNDLQNRLRDQQAALEKVTTYSRNNQSCTDHGKLRLASEDKTYAPIAVPSAQLRQLRVLKIAYEDCTSLEPYLPSGDSPVPGLLALRTVHKTIRDAKALLTSSQQDFQNVKQKLEKEHTDIQDANLITLHLNERIESLQQSLLEHSQKSPARVTRDLIQNFKRKIVRYEKETGKMIRAFNAFVDSHLAAMLAAEELGGPVVGDMLDVDELALESGFNSQGTMKRQQATQSEDKRQKRIDEIWGPPPPETNKSKQPWDETRAAAIEMRDLTEELLNSLVEAGAIGSHKDGYVQLTKESAAARFLVRSKVAQFSPRDSQRLRLINFGRDLDG